MLSEPLVNSNKAQILQAVTQERIPTIFGFREFVDAGGLMSYGANFPDLFSRAAEFVDKILRGTRPADIPVQQPVKFDLIVNLKAAKALGLKIPEVLLATCRRGDRKDGHVQIGTLGHADRRCRCPLLGGKADVRIGGFDARY